MLPAEPLGRKISSDKILGRTNSVLCLCIYFLSLQCLSNRSFQKHSNLSRFKEGKECSHLRRMIKKLVHP